MKPSFFKANRFKFMNALPKDSLVIISANNPLQRVNDTPFPFRQESNFWYLTGIEKPFWRLIMTKDMTCLIEPEISEYTKVFDGGYGDESIRLTSDISDILNIKEGNKLIEDLSQSKDKVYTLLPDDTWTHYDFSPNDACERLANELSLKFPNVEDCRSVLTELRSIKQPAEIEQIQRAIDITIHSAVYAMEKLKTLKYEYQFEALLQYFARSRYGESASFEPIIAGGSNATVMHYIANNSKLEGSNSWLLCDIGFSSGYYCSDIARTFPIIPNQYTPRQLDVYEAVLEVQKKSIDLLNDGFQTKVYLQNVQKFMGEALFKLKLIDNQDDEKSIRKFFPHAIGHGLGIDVHDSLGSPELFKENMVLTVEPGIYIPQEKFGVRIEDDILITEAGPKNLSEQLPSNINDLQHLVG